MQHALGFVASSGKVYPGGVYGRTGGILRPAAVNEESSFVAKVDSSNINTDNHPLFLQQINDPGACVRAFLVPFAHDKYKTDYGTSSEKVLLGCAITKKVQKPSPRWIQDEGLFDEASEGWLLH